MIMKKIAVVYSTKFGHTKQYADWLKEDVDADVMSLDGFNITKMVAYKLVIFACGVYGDKLPIMDYIKKNLSSIPAQKIMIMAVSWYTNDSEEASQRLIDENFPEQLKKVVPLYVVNSGLDKKKVPAMDKAKLIAAQMMIEKKDGRSSDDINALAIIKGYSDQTSRDNLASIKKGVEEFFDPSKKEEQPAAAVQPAAAPKASPAPAPRETRPEPKPQAPAAVHEDPIPQQDEPVVRFNSSGQVVVSSVLDAINSLNSSTPSAPAYKPAADSAVTEQKAETPAPKPVPKAETPAPAPQPQPSADDDISKLADEAFKNLGASKAAPKAEIPVPTPQPEPSLAEETAAPAPAQGPAAHQHKNSYMEMFASRRKKREEEAAAQPAPSDIDLSSFESDIAEPEVQTAAPAPKTVPETVQKAEPAKPSAPKDTEGSFIDFELDFSPELSKSEQFTFKRTAPQAEPETPKAQEVPAPKPAPKPVPKPEPPKAQEVPAPKPAPKPIPKPEPEPIGSEVIDFDDFEIIGEETKTASKRALNAVQDLAKAKAAAAAEAAKKAAAKEAALIAEEPAEEQTSAEEENTAVPEHGDTSGIIEKMKHDMELLVEESEHDAETAAEESYEEEVPQQQQEEDDGLSAFAFADTADYYAGDTKPVIEEFEDEPAEHHNADLDLRKLQEQINASIETNKANREKMQAKYGKKQKEAVHNPFAVQFDDEEDDKKDKKGKKQAPPPKRLDDPIDPDIFFSRPNKSKDFDMLSDTMPEIKFKNR